MQRRSGRSAYDGQPLAIAPRLDQAIEDVGIGPYEVFDHRRRFRLEEEEAGIDGVGECPAQDQDAAPLRLPRMAQVRIPECRAMLFKRMGTWLWSKRRWV